MSGIIYFRKDPSEYYSNMVGFDYTKRSSLVGCEIDSNFFVLEGRDVYDIYMDGEFLVFEFVDGTKKSLFVNQYEPGCGISIGNMDDSCLSDNHVNDNVISLRKKEMGGISCFDGNALVGTGCGIGVTTESNSCENFRNYLLKMLGNYMGNLYVNSLTKINGQFYGGVVSTDACSAPDCHNDQFYKDFLDYIRSGKLTINVCGIECLPDGSARVSVDNSTIVLDNCQIKVNYGCGLTEKDSDENDYLIWLQNNWSELVGVTPSFIGYITKEKEVNDKLYADNTDEYKNDQFYNTFSANEQFPKLSVALDECGGIACGNNGIFVDYGCGLEVKCEPTCKDYENFINNFLPDLKCKSCLSDIDSVKEEPCFSAFIKCWNKGVLSIKANEKSGLSCIGGGTTINIGEGITLKTIESNCENYLSFLSEYKAMLGINFDVNSYIDGSLEVNGEYFGGEKCPGCDPCNVWYNDQFFCDFVSYVNGGVITVNPIQNEISYDNLRLLQINGNLVPGESYLISDYATTTSLQGTQTAGKNFSLIVTANSESTFDSRATAVKNEKDAYFANSDLSKWEILYDIENDTEKYAWADSKNGKGVIYKMVDEWGNECPYDFKNIMFETTLTDGMYDSKGSKAYVYTFNIYDKGVCNDLSVSQMGIVSENKVGFGSFALFLSASAKPEQWVGNTIGVFCTGIIFNGNALFNKIGNETKNVVLSGYDSHNDIGDGCSNVYIGHDSEYNRICGNCTNIYLTDETILVGYYKNNIVEFGCNTVKIYPSENGSKCLQNVYVVQGVSNVNISENKIARDSSSRIVIRNASDTELTI